MPYIRALIFDMDGVIVNSEPLHVDAWNQVCQEFGATLTREMILSFKGLTVHEVAERLQHLFPSMAKTPLDDLVTNKNQALWDLSQDAQLIPGVFDFIQSMRPRVERMALATASDARMQQFFFDRFGLGAYFDAVTTGDELAFGKPNPEVYVKTLEKIQMAPTDSAVIEDAVKGIEAAKAAGCLAIGITTSFPKKSLEEAGADHVINQFNELSSYFLTSV